MTLKNKPREHFILNVITFFLLMFQISGECISKELITESSGFIKNISLHRTSDTTEYKIFTIKGHFKNNAGIYGITDCHGYREIKNNALLFLKVVCEYITQHGDSFFTLGERKSEFNKAGVGNARYLDGTGLFKKLIGTKCIYAVNKVLDSDFVVTKCDVSDDLFDELKMYGIK